MITRAARLTAALLERERLDAELAIMREIEARRLDERLVALGLAARQRTRWPDGPRMLGEITRQTLYRGPADWPGMTTVRVR